MNNFIEKVYHKSIHPHLCRKVISYISKSNSAYVVVEELIYNIIFLHGCVGMNLDFKKNSQGFLKCSIIYILHMYHIILVQNILTEQTYKVTVMLLTQKFSVSLYSFMHYSYVIF